MEERNKRVLVGMSGGIDSIIYRVKLDAAGTRNAVCEKICNK